MPVTHIEEKSHLRKQVETRRRKKCLKRITRAMQSEGALDPAEAGLLEMFSQMLLDLKHEENNQ